MGQSEPIVAKANLPNVQENAIPQILLTVGPKLCKSVLPVRQEKQEASKSLQWLYSALATSQSALEMPNLASEMTRIT